MDMYKLKFTSLQMEIFRLLCIKAGMQLNQRQMAKLLGVTPTSIANALPLLKKEKIITFVKGTTNLNMIGLNRDEKKTLELKRVENLKLLVESGLSDHLEEQCPGCTIILFGSYGRGDDTHTSDIDIAIIGSSDKKINLLLFEKKLEKEIRINYYKDLDEINPHLKSSILNGIVLAGGVEL